MASRAAFELLVHGSADLPAVHVDTYNEELRDRDGFIGDRASKRAFAAILDDLRERLSALGEDPLGDQPSGDIKNADLAALLRSKNPEKAGIVLGAIEEFAREFATVIRRFLRLEHWRETQRIAVGGGFSAGSVGKLAIGRTAVILKAEGYVLELVPTRHDPDDAGLLGSAHLAPPEMFRDLDAILAVDIGGTNIRAGIVELELRKNPTLADSRVRRIEKWHHAGDQPTRDEAVDKLIALLEKLIKVAAADKVRLAPFVGIGCPGIIAANGLIERGGQNLPGNWESNRFNLPERVRAAIPSIGGASTIVLMHNDAVVQGLSQTPFMQDVERWGILTIGTGLGNARFTNRDAP